jgi:hypothetical protein
LTRGDVVVRGRKARGSGLATWHSRGRLVNLDHVWVEVLFAINLAFGPRLDTDRFLWASSVRRFGFVGTLVGVFGRSREAELNREVSVDCDALADEVDHRLSGGGGSSSAGRQPFVQDFETRFLSEGLHDS